ncbi:MULTISPECIES: TetR/AcrR family transcriptional regulator [Streptomyces]|uniref:TetR/AcrR family transcriptional regulator n=1 Tax=Streptomyces TaxID=1883 RepID=UPI001319B6E6|nr:MULTISPECIES: TetR/AcrR family transcriptional regulator [Streptomyces]QGZ50096.1 TetR family transcriptional regulator [Streptomyces sp. QHH-9511]GGU04318.1 TetR family transcriptional regulator [Streptomyces lateritius]
MQTSTTGSTRDRIVVAASRLIQRQGYVGTGIKQIATEAEATLGSVYHFFPGGKEAVAVAAMEHGREEFAAVLRTALDGEDDPAEAVDACARILAKELRTSGWTDGCPVTAAALETLGTDNPIQRACAEALLAWQNLVADKLLGCGFPDPEARDLAATVINTLEGAEVTAQVTRSETPLLLAGRHLSRLVASYA